MKSSNIRYRLAQRELGCKFLNTLIQRRDMNTYYYFTLTIDYKVYNKITFVSSLEAIMHNDKQID